MKRNEAIAQHLFGSRNMHNFDLLKALGQAGKPVLLKRGLATTIEEFVMAAEYILSHGNPQVVLCERGIRSFDTYTRNVLDLEAVVALKQLTNLPVIVDPHPLLLSHLMHNRFSNARQGGKL